MNNIKNSFISAFDIDNKLLKELIIINTKCLVDDKIQRYVYVDNFRLKDELIYHKYYGTKNDRINLLNIILPAILANTNEKKSEEEVVSLVKKYILFFKKEDETFDYIISSVIYNCIIHTLLYNKNTDYIDLLKNIKNRIIEFSIEVEKKDIVKFQMKRIKTIKIIDCYIDLKPDDSSIVGKLLFVLYSIYIEDKKLEETFESIKKSILSILGEKIEYDLENMDFIVSLSDYIIKLRKYSISKKTYSGKSDPRSLISLNEKDEIIDQILGKIIVTSKRFENNILKITVNSKSGVYNFLFKKTN